MAGQFDFQQSSSPLLTALTEAPERKRQAELQQKQAQQERLNSLLNNMQQFATIGRTIQQGQQAALQQKQAQSQLQGQQNVQGILAEPEQQAPVSSFGFGPSQMPPTFGQTQQGGTQPQRLQSALAQGFPDETGQSLAKQQFPNKDDQYSLQPVQNADGSTTYSYFPKVPGKGSITPTNQNKPQPSQEGLDLKEEAHREKVFAALDKNLNVDVASSRSPIGRERERLGAGKRLFTLATSTGDNPTDIQMKEFAGALQSLIQGGGATGQVSEKLIDQLTPRTVVGDFNKKLQWLSNNPTGSGQQKFVQMFKQTALREAQNAEDNIRSEQVKALRSNRHLKLVDPTRWNEKIAAYGIDPDVNFKNGKFVRTPEIPSLLPDFDPYRAEQIQGQSAGGIPSVGGSFNGEKVISVKRIK